MRGVLKPRAIRVLVAAAFFLSLAAWVLYRHQVGATVRAGIAAVDITPPVGVPLAGYGSHARRLPALFDWLNKHPYATYFEPSRGTLDPIRAKTLLLDNGRSSLILISLDLVGIPTEMIEDIRQAIAARPEYASLPDPFLLVSATHTHSGPGTYCRDPVFSRLATDRFQTTIYNGLLAGIVESFRLACEGVQPAELLSLSVPVEGLQYNRQTPNGPVNQTAHLLWVRSDQGTPLGGLVNFAMHGTALPEGNLLFSADVPGAIERALEERIRNTWSNAGSPVFLFVNGAEGDIAPSHRGQDGMRTAANAFTDQVWGRLDSLKPLHPVWHQAHRDVDLGRARLDLRFCPSEYHWFRGASLDLHRHMPSTAPLDVIRIGDQVWVTWPGEATVRVEQQVREAAVRHGMQDVWFFGLTGGYLAYFTSADERRNPSYEVCNSLYGQEGTARFLISLDECFQAPDVPDH